MEYTKSWIECVGLKWNKPQAVYHIGWASDRKRAGRNHIMEMTIKVRINTHTVTLTNAKTGEIVKEFTQTRKPTDSKVIGDFIRECKAAKLPIPLVEMTDTVESEYREIDWSVFMANSRPVADKAEA